MARKRDARADRTLSDAARALRACGKTATEIGKLAGKTRQAATKWMNDEALPDPDTQALLAGAGLVQLGMWGRHGGQATPVAPPVAPPGAYPRTTGNRTPIQRLEDSLAEYDQLLCGGLSDGVRARLMTGRDAATERLGRLQGMRLTESTVLKAPAFRTILAAMQEALRPWPEAVRAVAIALRKLAEEEGAAG